MRDEGFIQYLMYLSNKLLVAAGTVYFSKARLNEAKRFWCMTTGTGIQSILYEAYI